MFFNFCSFENVKGVVVKKCYNVFKDDFVVFVESKKKFDELFKRREEELL